ncbi:outer membrane beta-barrel protein [Marinicellulosiphila megalodicopiae]|uniref:outer membrane beta-barrel protein n=1 Tax=Marinicellulosiphila megalodicopiae TaxID=2724896 RepID=UPI003BB11491
MKFFKTVIALSVLAASTSALSLDNNRKGFQIGIGAGAGKLVSQRSDEGVLEQPNYVDQFGVNTTFRLGGGISEHFSLFYINNVGWSADEYGINTAAVGGMAAQLFLTDSAPSLYVIGGGGLGSFSRSTAYTSASYAGLGFMAGVGYEIIDHVQIEAMWNQTGNNINLENYDLTMNSSSFGITLNYVWY